ncbi:hypothetical protein MTER_28740 [Mycolicibacter terrae]|uniref:Uncharacterized protein n=1 Tax=Mycolicibacter terrae TaxID=1788 RepID=A0AAD1HZ64_9MYCO|nr:hypothetical protein MTER_28740 [Mycolicibacter terrae]
MSGPPEIVSGTPGSLTPAGAVAVTRIPFRVISTLAPSGPITADGDTVGEGDDETVGVAIDSATRFPDEQPVSPEASNTTVSAT